jgi:hypothetical protein
MTRETFTIAAIAFVCGTAAATSPPVTFDEVGNIPLKVERAFSFRSRGWKKVSLRARGFIQRSVRDCCRTPINAEDAARAIGKIRPACGDSGRNTVSRQYQFKVGQTLNVQRSTLNAQFRSGFFVLVIVIVLKIHNHELGVFRKVNARGCSGLEKH